MNRAELTLDCVTDHPTNIISYAAEHEDPAIPTVRIAVSEYKELVIIFDHVSCPETNLMEAKRI